MGDLVQLPTRNGFNEQERSRIAAVADAAGASVAWQSPLRVLNPKPTHDKQ